MLDYVLFSFVLMCFLISIIKKSADIYDVYLLRLAMLLTVAADFFMVVLKLNVIGLIFFIAVQLAYVARYANAKRAAATTAAALCVLALSFAIEINAPFNLSLCYAVCLLSSVAHSFIKYKKRRAKNTLIAFLGMTFFLMCDINVALYNLSSGDIVTLFQILIWVFYLPSQLMLSLSATTDAV